MWVYQRDLDVGLNNSMTIDRLFIMYDDGTNDPMVFTYPGQQIGSGFNFNFSSYVFYQN